MLFCKGIFSLPFGFQAQKKVIRIGVDIGMLDDHIAVIAVNGCHRASQCQFICIQSHGYGRLNEHGGGCACNQMVCCFHGLIALAEWACELTFLSDGFFKKVLE